MVGMSVASSDIIMVAELVDWLDYPMVVNCNNMNIKFIA